MQNSAKHVAVIMDGNGRWAHSRSRSRFVGHVKGAKVAKNLIEHCSRSGLKYLTLFTFSTENWFRPPDEVSLLMRLLVKQMDRERATLIKNNVRFRVIGDFDRLPEKVRESLAKSIDATKENNGLQLTFALSYSGRQDLTMAMQDIAARIQSGEVKASDVNEDLISLALPSSFLPDPDLIIRTSGEHRLSNFFLWQSAYSEIYVTPKMWPEFTPADFEEALSYFRTRERRFGRTSAQVESSFKENGEQCPLS